MPRKAQPCTSTSAIGRGFVIGRRGNCEYAEAWSFKYIQEYSQGVFIPRVKGLLKNAQRIDVVWDTYIPDSLKATTRSKRGKGYAGVRYLTQKSQASWLAFLRIDENKQELFDYLTEKLAMMEVEQKKVIFTKGESVVCNGRRDD